MCYKLQSKENNARVFMHSIEHVLICKRNEDHFSYEIERINKFAIVSLFPVRFPPIIKSIYDLSQLKHDPAHGYALPLHSVNSSPPTLRYTQICFFESCCLQPVFLKPYLKFTL